MGVQFSRVMVGLLLRGGHEEMHITREGSLECIFHAHAHVQEVVLERF